MEANHINHLDAVLDRLEGVRRHNGYHKALCPAHDDRNPSLSIRLNGESKVSLKCHAGCDDLAILDSIGLSVSDLYPPTPNGHHANGHHANGHHANGHHATKKRITKTYDYTDHDGNLLHQTVRYKPKGFKQRRPNGNGGWTWNLAEIEPVLYRLPEVAAAVGEERTIFVVEGEWDADNAREQLGVTATTCPMGAGKWRDSYTEALRGAHVAVIPDNDIPGRRHAEDVAARLVGKAAVVKVVELPGVGPGGDLSDWIKAGGTREDLHRRVAEAGPPAPEEGEEEKNPLLAERVDLGAVVSGGIEPPEELEPDILLKGMIHHLFGPSESGKTIIALWLIKRRVEARQRVVLFDAENGARTIGERLKLMGVNPALLSEYLVYLPFPALTTDARHRNAFEDLLDEIKPEAIFFDSWASFLSSAGFSENENSEIEHWDNAFTKMAKKRGITSVILDHVPHDGLRSRGGARKKEVADVQWRVKKTQEFNRDAVGEVLLISEKDREGWLPGSIGFSVGGADGTLLCARSSGTVEEPDPVDGLTANERKVLDALREEFGQRGARANEWKRASEKRGVSRATHFRAVKRLVSTGLTHEPLVRLVDETYFPIEKPDPTKSRDTGESSLLIKNETQVSQVSNRSHETGETGAESQGLTGLSPLKGETVRPTADTTPARTVREALEALRTTALAPLVEQFFGGTAETPILASAVAAHYREGGRWKEWREPTLQALDELKENRVAAVEDEST